MDDFLNEKWELHPVGGNTGKAFMGVNNNEKVFLKKNTSPFLLALSLESITPKLVWTKRMGNGDIMTAQEWLNGHTLTREEMTSGSVIDLLKKIHFSPSLKKMLRRVGGKVMTAENILADYYQNLSDDLRKHDLLSERADFLKRNLAKVSISTQEMSVCHGDLNHKNWLMSEKGNLFLVDWDAAMVADPAADISTILGEYIDKDFWEEWLIAYGKHDAAFQTRICWYVQMYLLEQIKTTHEQQRFHEMNQYILRLEECACSLG